MITNIIWKINYNIETYKFRIKWEIIVWRINRFSGLGNVYVVF